jgi:predicted phage terminase large subunit-like protein
VNMPPRYGKSLIISVFFPVWLWLRDPSRRMMFASYAAALSTKHSVDRRTLIESVWFQRRWGHKVQLAKGSNLKDEFSNTARGHMIATSVGAAATGKGGDLLIVDDLPNPTEAESDAERAFGIRWYRETFSTRLNNKKSGAIIIIEQRTHPADLTGQLLEGGGKRWKHVVLPAIAEERQVINFPSGRQVVREIGDILWPALEDADALQHQKFTMGSHAFECQYQQNPEARGGNQFLDKWLRSYTSLPAHFNLKAMAIDTAFSTGQEADFSAIAIVGYLGHPDGANPPGFYLERVWRGRVGFAGLKRKTVELFSQHNKPTSPIHMVLVANAGLSLIPELRAETGLPVVPMVADTDKRVRASRIEPLVESGLLYLPECAPWLGDFRSELLAFPAGRNDDQVDALVYALTRLREASDYDRNYLTWRPATTTAII